MIIDTTQTKIERDISFAADTDTFFAALIEAAKRRSISYDGCSCHISPPCSYCVAHAECEICGELSLGEYMVEINGCLACEECYDRKRESDE